MAVLERVATLVRANLNDLIDRAEDPEKMIKQVILDMENQLLQVKTQVAISMADQHLLQKKQTGAAGQGGRVDAQGGARGRQGAGRPGPRRARALPELHEAGRRLHAAGGRPAAAGRRAAPRARTARSEAGRGAREERLLIAQHRRARALERASDAQLAMRAPVRPPASIACSAR